MVDRMTGLPVNIDTEPLGPEATAQLIELARTFKAAARAQTLYPPGHPALTQTLGRLERATAAATAGGPLVLGVLPGSLTVGARVPAKSDPAIGDFAALLHERAVGRLVLRGSLPQNALTAFLTLLARPPEELRAQGGIKQLWSVHSAPDIELDEIDYREVTRERGGAAAADTPTLWNSIIESCLEGRSADLDDTTRAALADLADNVDQLAAIMARVSSAPAGSGAGHMTAQSAALLRLFQQVAKAVGETDAAKVPGAMANLGAAALRLSPEVLLELVRNGRSLPGGPEMLGELGGHLDDHAIARFTAGAMILDGGASARIAEAFQTLVIGEERRRQVLSLAREQVAQSPLGAEMGFGELWKSAEDMLLSYSDEKFLSDEYRSQLSAARTRAAEVDRLQGDPPERIAGWVQTVSENELRALGVTLLLDLLRLESSEAAWQEGVKDAVALAEQLIVERHLDQALRLVREIASARGPDAAQPRGEAATAALEELATGAAIKAALARLKDLDENEYAVLRQLLQTFGPASVGALVEAVTGEHGQTGSAPRRLRELLIGFGAASRGALERLTRGGSPEMRRTAAFLLREIGGHESLRALAAMLTDSEPTVQREAVRAIVRIGNEHAYASLHEALVSGSSEARTIIMQAIGELQDERAVPLLVYLASHARGRRDLRHVLFSVVSDLGALGGAEAVRVLRDLLWARQWWAPRRTRATRAAAASALRRIGTPEAMAELRRAVTEGGRGVRQAAKLKL